MVLLSIYILLQEVIMSEKVKKCMMCAKPSTETICESCKVKVQGEAAEKKIKIGKSVEINVEVKADKLSKE